MEVGADVNSSADETGFEIPESIPPDLRGDEVGVFHPPPRGESGRSVQDSDEENFVCYEPANKEVYFNNGCGHVLDQTEEECKVSYCNPGLEMRTAWGERPEWCAENGGK